VGVSQTAAFNRGRHLYSAGRPSGWALAHILVLYVVQLLAYFGICRYFMYMTIPVVTPRIGHLQLFIRSVAFLILEVSTCLWFGYFCDTYHLNSALFLVHNCTSENFYCIYCDSCCF